MMMDDIEEQLQALKSPTEDAWYVAMSKLTAKGSQNIGIYLQILQSPPSTEDPEDLIRGYIAEILGEIGDQRAFEPLIEAAGPQSEFLQEKSIGALGKLGDRRAIGFLVAHLSNHWNPDLREEAAWALANFPDDWVIRVLVRVFSDKSQIVRDAATFALIKIGETARNEILKASNSVDQVVREQALETLAELDKKLRNEKA